MREVHYHDWLSNPVMVKKSDFLWTEEAETAFKQMKEHIAKLPMLTAPESIQGSGERRTNDGKGSQADANLLCKPGTEGPRNKLHRHGKISTGISTCKQKAKKILPSSPYHTDFIVERPEDEGEENSEKEEELLLARWTLFMDG
ncbi:hypothetical protein Tco_0306132, partial [Tanacetum coccineum]